jgi:hypothetical protein
MNWGISLAVVNVSYVSALFAKRKEEKKYLVGFQYSAFSASHAFSLAGLRKNNFLGLLFEGFQPLSVGTYHQHKH